MNASRFMDKQIMELSRSKSSNDFIGRMDRKEDTEVDGGVKKEDIQGSYDFQPIRPAGVSSNSMEVATNSSNSSINAARAWNSADPKANSSAIGSYGYVDFIERSQVILEKAQSANDLAIVSEIDQTIKKHTDNLLHSIDGLSARLSQLESRMRQLENSVDDLKVSTGDSHGSTDEKMRRLENILREVHAGVQNMKDKQEVMEAQMHLAKLQTSMVDQTPEIQSHPHINPVQQAASAPHPSSQQFSVPVQQLSSLPPNASPPKQNVQPPTPLPSQFPQSQIPSVPQRDTYFLPPGQTQEAPSLLYQMTPAYQQQPPPSQQHQQFQPPPSLAYPQLPQQHPSVATVNHPPQHQPPPLGNLPEETPYIPYPNYQANLHQPSSQPAAVPPKQFYGPPPPVYEPSSSRSNPGLSPRYVPPPGPIEPHTYTGSPRHGSGSSMKPSQVHPSSGGSGYNPQLPTARILPQAIPSASAASGGSVTGGPGNRVPIDDVIDKVTNMGFPREHVRAAVRILMENGQSVDLNVVLDKLMNDGEVQPQRGWFGR